MNPEGVSISTLLTFLGGVSLGGTVMYVMAIDHYAKRLEEVREVAYGMGYSNGMTDAKRNRAEAQP